MRLLLRTLDRLADRLADQRDTDGFAANAANAEAESLQEEERRRAEALEEHGGFRSVERHRIGEPLVDGGIGWQTEETHYADGLTQTVVQERSVRRCACNTLLSYGVSAAGLCSQCGAAVCEKCEGRCERCGDVVCPRHALRFREHAFCLRHRWRLYWLLWWRALE